MSTREYLEKWIADNPLLFATDMYYPGAVTPMPAPPKRQGHPRFYELLAEMERIHGQKNSDYADSASDPLKNFRACEAAGIPAFEGCITRMLDKVARISNLVKKEKEGREIGVKSESILDTLLDLSNYALIAIILYEEKRDE